eukprot:8842811-Ditylum_brightwellii.AAC.1
MKRSNVDMQPDSSISITGKIEIDFGDHSSLFHRRRSSFSHIAYDNSNTSFKRRRTVNHSITPNYGDSVLAAAAVGAMAKRARDASAKSSLSLNRRQKLQSFGVDFEDGRTIKK